MKRKESLSISKVHQIAGPALLLLVLGNQEGHIQCLLVVQAGIAVGLVALQQLLVQQFHGPTNTFGNMVSSQLEMDAAQVRSKLLVDADGLGQLAGNVDQVSCLDSGYRLLGAKTNGKTKIEMGLVLVTKVDRQQLRFSRKKVLTDLLTFRAWGRKPKRQRDPTPGQLGCDQGGTCRPT